MFQHNITTFKHPKTALIQHFWFKHLALLGGNCCVPVDEFGEDSPKGLNTQRQRCHIQQQHVSDITSQHATLDGCSNGNGLVRVDRLAGSTAEQVLNSLLNLQTKAGLYMNYIKHIRKWSADIISGFLWTRVTTM